MRNIAGASVWDAQTVTTTARAYRNDARSTRLERWNIFPSVIGPVLAAITASEPLVEIWISNPVAVVTPGKHSGLGCNANC